MFLLIDGNHILTLAKNVVMKSFETTELMYVGLSLTTSYCRLLFVIIDITYRYINDKYILSSRISSYKNFEIGLFITLCHKLLLNKICNYGLFGYYLQQLMIRFLLRLHGVGLMKILRLIVVIGFI
jgi:hypothetical protein